MQPTDCLKDDHKAIKRLMKLLGVVCVNLEDNRVVEAADLQWLVDFIVLFADKYHHKKEEDILFEWMEQYGVPKQGGPVGVMLQEHEKGRRYVQALNEAVKNYKIGDETSRQQYILNARNYINLLTPHIDKEDYILYEIAEAHIPEEKKAELQALFDQAELKVLGANGKEDILGQLSQLEKKF